MKSSLRGSWMILHRSFSDCGDPAQILPNSWWEALVGILVKSSKRSLHDLVQVLVRRSCGDPAEFIRQKVLAFACIRILKMLCMGACMTVLLGSS